jgi:fumarate reductase subunit D
MKKLLIVLEPVIWFLFGQGIMIGTILLTGWLIVVGVGVPIGLFPADALDYERAHMLGANIIGRVVLLGLIVLPLWKGAHHVRSLLVDFGGGDRDALVGSLLYGIATVGSVLGVLAVVRL